MKTFHSKEDLVAEVLLDGEGPWQAVSRHYPQSCAGLVNSVSVACCEPAASRIRVKKDLSLGWTWPSQWDASGQRPAGRLQDNLCFLILTARCIEILEGHCKAHGWLRSSSCRRVWGSSSSLFCWPDQQGWWRTCWMLRSHGKL